MSRNGRSSVYSSKSGNVMEGCGVGQSGSIWLRQEALVDALKRRHGSNTRPM